MRGLCFLLTMKVKDLNPSKQTILSLIKKYVLVDNDQVITILSS